MVLPRGKLDTKSHLLGKTVAFDSRLLRASPGICRFARSNTAFVAATSPEGACRFSNAVRVPLSVRLEGFKGEVHGAVLHKEAQQCQMRAVRGPMIGSNY
jgi:hypothetical protein